MLKSSDEVLVWLSGVRCRLFAYDSADATAIPQLPSSLASLKSRLVLPFWYRFTQVVLEKRPLNGCSVVVYFVLDCAYASNYDLA